jgi:hypothetical protein
MLLKCQVGDLVDKVAEAQAVVVLIEDVALVV